MTKEEKKAYAATWCAANTEKNRAYKKAWYAANVEKARATSAAWKAANPGRTLANSRMRKYGLSPEAFQLMLLGQKNACGICKEIFSKEPHVDHCHKTGQVRGLLCRRCNRALGLLKDSVALLKSAEEYLQG